MISVHQLINKKRQLEDMDVNPLIMFAEAWEYKQKRIERFNAVAEMAEDWKEISMRALNGCKILKSSVNWVHVRNIVGVGSTRATKICVDLGVDPEGIVFKKRMEKVKVFKDIQVKANVRYWEDSRVNEIGEGGLND